MTLTRDLLRSAAGLDAAPRRPRRPPLPLGILGVLLLAAGVTWLLLGLRDAAGVVRREATAARTELETVKSALEQGDTRGAAEHLSAARTHLTAADAAATRTQVRLIGLVPVLGWPADDLGHLLRAAQLVTSSADDALRLYQDVGGKKPTLFARDRFDLAQLDRMSRTGNRLSRSLSGARRERTDEFYTHTGR